MFSNEMYDKLKWIAQILLPALGIDVFLGVILKISTDNYNKDLPDDRQ